MVNLAELITFAPKKTILMESLFTGAGLVSMLTLTLMEIVLGIDNLVFVSIVSTKLPKEEQKKAQQIGLILALGIRIVLLFGIGYLASLEQPVTGVIPILNVALSWRDIILLAGGIFLLYKATSEIHQKLEGHEENVQFQKGKSELGKVIFEITLLNLVFSVDSILTAVGLVKEVSIMIIAVVISMVVMIIFVNSLSNFIQRHPTVKILGLSFLMLIGVMLIIEGLHQHVEKSYFYFAIFFSLAIEMLNIRLKKVTDKPVDLRDEYVDNSIIQK